MTIFLSISDVKSKLSYLVGRVNKRLDRIIVTVNGQPKVTLISNEDLESIEEDIEMLSDKYRA